MIRARMLDCQKEQATEAYQLILLSSMSCFED